MNNTTDINNLPTTTEEDEMFKTMAEMSRETKDAMVEILHTRHVTEPQPALCESTQTPDLSTIINTICTQLQLLTTIINQPKAQPEGANLQDCVEQVLQQAVWFEKMVEEQVESHVESEVESYFQHGFDPSHFYDFDDAVGNEVNDRLDDIVRDQLDDVVADKLEDAVAEKLKSIRVVFD